MLLAWLCQVGANTGSDDNYVDLVSTGTRVKPVRLLPEEHPQRDAEERSLPVGAPDLVPLPAVALLETQMVFLDTPKRRFQSHTRRLDRFGV